MIDERYEGGLIIQPDGNRLKSLQRKISETLAPLLGDRKICYVDLPIYLNIGDMLIEKGTCTLFSSVNASIQKRVALLDQECLFKGGLPEDVVVVLQGGGNFGDLYPHHQKLRLRVIQAFPRNRIVMLPQTVYFSQPETFRQEAEVFRRHSDLHLFARDKRSEAQLLEHLPMHQVGFLPDMATMLYGTLPEVASKSSDVLLFRRRDIETVRNNESSGFDWKDLMKKSDRRRYRSIKRRLKFQNRTGIPVGGHTRWISFREAMIAKAVTHYHAFGCVDTDRLHGFILAQLLNMPAIARDNSYGKLTELHQAAG